ncbi:MAG: hypothetical protein CVU05_02140 [Bacteroidetes bacterium HGW-Bacteroidetes-21]|jgi:hypothetical protein|nr:MAG: hypothetical protein CVU05_02140 [Bacteroidetes bacterium HGW-Bacteroidetes-21]
MKNLLNYIQYLVYVLLGVSALMGLLFYAGVIGESLLLGWAYVLLIVAAASSLLFPIAQFVMNPKGAKGAIFGILGLVAVAVVTYLMSSGEPLDILGYTGTDNNPSTLKLSDMGLFTTYFLMFGALIAILVTEVYNAFK